MQKLLRATVWICLLTKLAATPVCQAAITDKDVQVAGRVLEFLSAPPPDTLRVGIIYDPANPVSLTDERTLLGILGSGLRIAGVKLKPIPVPLDQLSNADFDMIFLTNGLGSAAVAAGKAAAARRIPCITTDIAANRAGFCAIAVKTAPNVQIIVNSSALTASGVTFTTAFLLMVTEI